MKPHEKATLALGLALVFAWAADSRAQTNDAVTAEALFQEGRRLMAESRFEEACPKLAESNRIDPGVGVLLYLGDCYERAGKLASAWATFHEAVTPSRKSGQRDREETARTRAAALEPRLPKLIVQPPASPPPGYAVRRGGVEIAAATFGVAVPLDPGTYTIEASAPGHESVRLEVVAEEGKLGTLSLPPLEATPEAQGAPPSASATSGASPAGRRAPGGGTSTGSWTGQRSAGLVVAGGGLVGLGIGAGFGVAAMNDWSDAEARCTAGGSGVICDARGAELASSAESSAWVSTAGFAAGGALIAVGAVLYFTSDDGPEQTESALRVLPLAGPQLAGLALMGSF